MIEKFRNKLDVLCDLQIGDVGKGKMVDYLSSLDYNIVARFAGSDNSGHTLFHNGEKIVLHNIPSGIINPNIKNVMGTGMVINPISLKEEIENVQKHITDILDRIYIMDNIYLTTPVHLTIDSFDEKIGTTKKGVGPAYSDRIGRRGVLLNRYNKDLKYNFAMKATSILVKRGRSFDYNNVLETEKLWHESVEWILKNVKIITNQDLRNWVKGGDTVLAEGAQGSRLDILHGSYPFVTSSNTIASFAPTGLGLPAQSLNRVYGVYKAYITRVGAGGLKTLITDDKGEVNAIHDKIVEVGKEYGATTGRRRRCGWLNLDELKEDVELNGVTDLVMTKADVLNNFEEVQLYSNGEYVKFKGWSEVSLDNNEFKAWVDFIEYKLEMPISIISHGPNKNDIIVR